MTRLGSSDLPNVQLISRNFPPLRGGMERLNARLFQYLHSKGAGPSLVGPVGAADHAPKGARVVELVPGPLPITLLSALTRGITLAREARPDIVLAGSGLTAPAAVAAAFVVRATPAVFLHGLDVIAPNWFYRHVWLPCIRRCKNVLVNSANTRELAIQAGVDERRIRIVNPGTDLPSPDPGARARFRRRHGLNDTVPVLLSVGRLTARKGLTEFVLRSLPSIRAVHPEVRLILIGDQAQDAVHRGRGSGIDRVMAAVKAIGLVGSVIWLGTCTDSELADAYQGADVHVFPVLDIEGDVEGFGMVAIEAASHGLPTVAFDVGGVSDAVHDGRNGYLIAEHDYQAFSTAVLSSLTEDRESSDARARGFAQRFSWDRFGSEVIEALTDVRPP